MSAAACAALVQRADPDRFRAAMAAPVAARAVLFPLYAFNAEVARAPWVTQEPLIAQMRLQWWRDALAEIAGSGPVRRHEVVTPLAAVLTPEMVHQLDDLVAARLWDIDKTPFPDMDALIAHLERGSGRLMQVAATALGAGASADVAEYARAAAIAGWLRAVPALRARNCPPAPLTGDLVELAQLGLRSLQRARQARVAKPARAALLAGWQSGPILRAALRDPERIEAGKLAPDPLTSSLRLIRQVATGRL